MAVALGKQSINQGRITSSSKDAFNQAKSNNRNALIKFDEYGITVDVNNNSNLPIYINNSTKLKIIERLPNLGDNFLKILERIKS